MLQAPKRSVSTFSDKGPQAALTREEVEGLIRSLTSTRIVRILGDAFDAPAYG